MRLVVAITGASGAIFGIRILEELKKKNVETHLIVSKWGGFTIEEETGYEVAEVEKMASFSHDVNDLSDIVASGSFKTDGMIVAPCSMKTLAGIAMGFADDLITRVADVTIKEKRRLLLMARETPLSPIHLENMLKLSRLGVIIMPPVPTFYTGPATVDDIVNQTVARALEYFGVETEHIKRWRSS
jgi:4-hydroxy-3-polyprenylbenzoate decarboxylase